MNGIKEKLIEAMLGNSFDNAVNKVREILTVNIFSGAMHDASVSVANVVKPLALTIISLLFLIEFIRLILNEDMIKPTWLLKGFFKLVLAKAAIDMGDALLSAIYQTSASWVNSIGGSSISLGSTFEATMTAGLDGAGLWETLGIFASCMIFSSAIKVVAIIIQVIAYARNFELLAYLAVSPLPCAFITSEDSRIAKNFFLNFAGVCMQGVFMILSIKLYGTLCTDSLNNAVSASSSMVDACLTMLLASLVLLMAIIKSGQWGQKIFNIA